MKVIGYGLGVVVFLLGLYTIGAGAIQAREDYGNFRKIVLWVAQKQAQEAEYVKRQAAKQQAAPVPAAAPATGGQ
jgi:hypothetical protein